TISRYASLPDLHSFPTRRSSDLTETYRRTCELSTGCSRRKQRCRSCSSSRRCSARHTGSRAEIRVRRRQLREVLGDRPQWDVGRSEEHTSELQSRFDLVCRLLLE